MEASPEPLQPSLPKTGDLRESCCGTGGEVDEGSVRYYEEGWPTLASGLFFAK